MILDHALADGGEDAPELLLDFATPTGAVPPVLSLECCVPANTPWAHLDVYAWNDSDRPGRPCGGEAMALACGVRDAARRYAG